MKAICLKCKIGNASENDLNILLPTVKELQLDDCLQIAIQSLVTEVSGCVNNPLEVHSFSAHTTVVPEVFS